MTDPADTAAAVRAALAAAGIQPRPAGDRRSWDRRQIAEAFVHYFRAFGRWPSPDDLNPTLAAKEGHAERLARFHSGDYPYLGTVYNHYSTWPSARAAAKLRLRELEAS